MADYYKLVGMKVVPVADIATWGKWYNKTDRKVAFNTVGDKDISTVFLALDHSFGRGAPLLFETMVFPHGDFSGLYCERYTTWEEAKTGHYKIVDMVRDGTLLTREDE